MNIAIVVPNFAGGGAARVAATVSNEMVKLGHSVVAISFEDPGAHSFYKLDPKVSRRQIGCAVSRGGLLGTISNNARRIFTLRRVLRQMRPDGIISFLLDANISTVIAGRSLGIYTIISERNHPAFDRIGHTRSLIRCLVYPLANNLCVQTADISRWFEKNLGLASTIVPNPVNQALWDDIDNPEFRNRSVSARRMISLGRLEHQKGHDRLIDAFALLADQRPDWDLDIFGEGSLRFDLQAQIDALGLSERVRLRGVTQDAFDELRRCDLYVHAARYEGFPNAILEALAAGRCVLAVDAPGAARELLKDGEFGIISPDGGVEVLANHLLTATGSDELRKEFASRSRAAVRHLDPAAISALWLSLVPAQEQ